MLDPRPRVRTSPKSLNAFTTVFCSKGEDRPRVKRLEDLQRQAWAAKLEVPDTADVTVAYGSTVVAAPDLWEEFARPPEELADDLLVPESAGLLDILTRDFVGRQSFTESVDQAIADPAFRSGYVLITGEPGIGKSALMAHLISTRKWMHHFNSVSGSATTEAFLRNICAQLVIRHQLRCSALPDRAGRNSGFLLGLLSEAARRQTGPLIIAVDAIDEASDAGRQPGSNRLCLPTHLPENVYIVVTSRGRNAYELDAESIRHIKIEDRSEANRADLALYVAGFVQRNAARMTRILRSAEEQNIDFMAEFLRRSDGNFLYAARVLPEIEDGSLSGLDDVRRLPMGLREYYKRHWAAMQAADPVLFEELHRPVIKAFAMVEVMSAQVIAETWRLPAHRVRRAIGFWREFLNEIDHHVGPLSYRIYHKSFLDFLRLEIDLRDTQRQMVDHGVRVVSATARRNDPSGLITLEDLDAPDDPDCVGE